MCGAEVQRTTQGTSTTTNNYQWRRRIWSGRSTEAQETRTGNTILGALERIWGQTRSMDSRNGIATCKTGSWRLLDKAFETNPIKRRGKIPLRQLKKLLEILAISENVFQQQQQQQRYNTHFFQSLHFQKNQQHGSSTSYEKRKRRLDEVISQDIERVGDNDWSIENGEGHKETDRRSKHYPNRGGRNYLNSKHQ